MGNLKTNKNKIKSANQSSLEQDLIRLITAPWRAQCLYVAVKLEIPDLISRGIKDDSSLSSYTGVSEDRIKRLMRVLVTNRLFKENQWYQYDNTDASLKLMNRGDSMRDTILLYGGEMYHCWGRLDVALRSERSGFEIEYSQSFYAYLERKNEVARRFQRTLQSRSEIFEAIPHLIDFSGSLFVDIGGGSGDLIRVILDAASSAKAILLDQASALAGARNNLGDLVNSARVSLIQGDMFDNLPKGADVYFLSRVLGDLGDSEASRLLDNCRKAVCRNARLFIIEQLISDSNPTEIAALWDLHLMMMCNGRQRTMSELEVLLDENGFNLERVISLPLSMSLLIVS